MLNSIKALSLFYIICIFLSSCASKKDPVYFQGDPNAVLQKKSYVNEFIHENDILNISVSALDMTSIAPFVSNKALSTNKEQLLIGGYTVAMDGSVNLPLIGNIVIAGLSTINASIKIEKELQKSIIDPIVNIRVLNWNTTSI